MKKYLRAIAPSSISLAIVFMITTLFLNNRPIDYSLILTLFASFLAAILCATFFYVLSPNKYNSLFWSFIRLLGVIIICSGIVLIGNRNLKGINLLIDLLVFITAYVVLAIIEYLKTKSDAEKINQKLGKRHNSSNG